MINRFFYKSSLSDFLSDSIDTIFGKISRNDEGDSAKEQKFAWSEEIEIMQEVLSPWKEEYGEILFEYSIPRLGKRIDVVVLLRGLVFVIEFKAGKQEYLQADMEQVMDYALDLKNFHLDSHHRTIVPILVATEANVFTQQLRFSVYNDQIYNPLLTNSTSLQDLIASVVNNEHAQPSNANDFAQWAISRYSPTPTIIEAASALYQSHTVEDITRHEAAGAALEDTTQFVLDIIEKSKKQGKRAFVSLQVCLEREKHLWD